MEFTKMPLTITEGWIIKQHEFYNVDPSAESPDDEEKYLSFLVEDILQITKANYILDLGWYGGERKSASFCIRFLRGNFLHGELLEQFKSRSKIEIADKLNEIISCADAGKYDNMKGHRIDASDPDNGKAMAALGNYSALDPR